MRPRVLNFSRPLYLREIMVQNGDAHKPIWITEMNWNAPPEDFANKQFGYVTAEQQARYAVEAFQRAQAEWPWVGVINVWFFKRASDAERDQAMYYFRLVEPDFTPQPVYQALKDYFHSDAARRLYPGVHQEDHWALTYEGPWETRQDPQAELGAARYTPDSSGASLAFAFQGSDLWLKVGPGVRGAFLASIDGGPEQKVAVEGGQQVQLAGDLSRGPHTVSLRAASGTVSVDSLTVRQRPPIQGWLIAGLVVIGLALLGVLLAAAIARRRPWYERSRVW
jgi:hypothetical protein